MYGVIKGLSQVSLKGITLGTPTGQRDPSQKALLVDLSEHGHLTLVIILFPLLSEIEASSLGPSFLLNFLWSVGYIMGIVSCTSGLIPTDQ